MSRFSFREDVISEWKAVWSKLCDMAYKRQGIQEEVCVIPTSSNEVHFYERNTCHNYDELTLDYTWEKYSKEYRDVYTVPELKRIYVPRSLFECLGVYKWFEVSFPNCKIEFWETKK